MEYHHHPNHPESDPEYPMAMKKGFFDLIKQPCWRLVIFDFVIGMPLSLVVSFLTKCVMRLIFAAALYFNTRQVTGDNETALTVKSTAVNGTTGPPNLEVGGNKEEWIQWERLLCGLVFAITNSFLIIRWALAFEASGIESMAKERRLGMLKEEANEWESLVGKLESVLDTIHVEEYLKPVIQRFQPRLPQLDGINVAKRRTGDAQQRIMILGVAYHETEEERRRRSDGPPPETPMLGLDGKGGFGAVDLTGQV